MAESYSNVQRIAFGGVVLGFLLCAVGGIAPFWQSGTVKIGLTSIPFLGSATLAELSINCGLWFFCLKGKVITGEEKSECYQYGEDDDPVAEFLKLDADSKLWVCRIACAVCLLLSLVCALAGLCRQCCCSGGKTVCHGIMTFLAGVAGIISFAIYAHSYSDGFNVLMIEVGFGWSFFLFAVGSSLIALLSFVLCFTSPNTREMISRHSPFPTPVPYGPMVTVSHNTQQAYPLNQTEQVPRV